MTDFTLVETVRAETVVRKSRFIAQVAPVADRTAALGLLERARADHPNATHVCWALLAGGESAANDDGEPGGTAGRPMLEVLRLQSLEGVLAIVVRYFGGVKLGAGGLSRAYGGAVAEALRDARKVPRQRLERLHFAAPYPLEGRIRRLLEKHGAHLVNTNHGASVSFEAEVAEPESAALRAALEEAGGGRIAWP